MGMFAVTLPEISKEILRGDGSKPISKTRILNEIFEYKARIVGHLHDKPDATLIVSTDLKDEEFMSRFGGLFETVRAMRVKQMVQEKNPDGDESIIQALKLG